MRHVVPVALSFALTLCAGALASTRAYAEPPASAEPTIDAIRTRIHDLENSAHNEDATPALNHARRAADASEALAATEPAAALRAREIAWAALDLAATTIEFSVERETLRRARARAGQAKQRALEARLALETVRARRSENGPPSP